MISPDQEEDEFCSRYRDSSVKYIIGIGNPEIKERIALRLRDANISNSMEGYIYDSNTEYRRFGLNTRGIKEIFKPSIGLGSVISPGVTMTTNLLIGRDTIINCGVNLGHDVVICNGCQINPGSVVSGDVFIDNYTLVGCGAVILENLSIGTNVIIGAGAVVTKDIEDNVVVVGVPAKVIRKNRS
jgi:acetyltransferase-like isoleucine patch superfamily enzyme